MRGARIAEKIQEFYQTTTVPAGGFTSGSQTLNLGSQQSTSATANATKTKTPHRYEIAGGKVTVGNNRGSKMILLGNQPAQNERAAQGTGQSKPRATSAYGSHASRRNLHPHMMANER